MNDICKLCEEPISMCVCDFAIASTGEALQYMRQRIAELEARLDAVQNCPVHETTGCDSSGETFAVVYLLKDDVLKAISGG